MKSFLTNILIAALTLLGVFVKDFPGRETAASAIIARISEAVYSHIVSRTSLTAGFAVAAR